MFGRSAYQKPHREAIDINDPQLTDRSVKILPDFAALDNLILATSNVPQDLN